MVKLFRDPSEITKIQGMVGILTILNQNHLASGDSWMYPYQRTPMGNPYISPIYSGY